MRPNAETNTGQFFDQYAVDFSKIYGTDNSKFSNLLNHIFRRSMYLRFQQVLAECRPIENRTVLDIGCGPGLYAVTLAKLGARKVVGIDLADRMVNLAKEYARSEGVEHKCDFFVGDFATSNFDEKFDYTVIMGVMDYIAAPAEFISNACNSTHGKVLVSFPEKSGILAQIRKVRYKNKCDLYLYNKPIIDRLMNNIDSNSYNIDKLARDYFLTIKTNTNSFD